MLHFFHILADNRIVMTTPVLYLPYKVQSTLFMCLMELFVGMYFIGSGWVYVYILLPSQLEMSSYNPDLYQFTNHSTNYLEFEYLVVALVVVSLLTLGFRLPDPTQWYFCSLAPSQNNVLYSTSLSNFVLYV